MPPSCCPFLANAVKALYLMDTTTIGNVNYYEVLDGPQTASQAEAKSVRNEWAKIVWPDYLPEESQAVRDKAEQFYIWIQEAYEKIQNPQLRFELDENLKNAPDSFDPITAYDILGIAPDASAAKIDQAYSLLVRIFGRKDLTPEVQERARSQYQQIEDAYRQI